MASASAPRLSASAFSPNSSRRQPESAGTLASSSAAMPGVLVKTPLAVERHRLALRLPGEFAALGGERVLSRLRSLPKGFERSKLGEGIIDAVKRGLARDPKTLPSLHRPKPAANGQATVELLKVLLRMISERHHVAAKVIATVDDLERIAASDRADVPALKGWRRELFGDKALALKHGDLALAIDRGKVAAVPRERPQG